VTGNAQYNQALLLISQQVKNGQTLNQAFKNTQLFSNRAVQMIYIGEESGRLDEMLQKLSDYFEGQVDNKIENLTHLLEPALMIFLSGVVGTLVVAMYLPIFRLGTVL
jgi:type IV pilus assembly protein PilC